MSATQKTAEAWFDAQDPNSTGWAYRYYDANGTENSGPLDETDPGADLLEIAAEVISLDDAILRVNVYSPATEQIALVQERDGSYRWA